MPLAEHDIQVDADWHEGQVSIHVPLAEHDLRAASANSALLQFQFTCPSRSTTGTSASHSAI